MQVLKLVDDDDAVSPVIGVILMVAITVILAAVIASFVLGLGDQTNTQPQASLSWDYTDTDSGTGYVKITHDGGDTIRANDLYVRGSGFANPSSAVPDMTSDSGDHWEDAGGNASGEKDGESAVVSGDSFTVGVDNDYELRVVYEAEEGDTSATLSEDEGPQTS
jgi:flagellin-like protein